MYKQRKIIYRTTKELKKPIWKVGRRVATRTVQHFLYETLKADIDELIGHVNSANDNTHKNLCMLKNQIEEIEIVSV